MPATKDRLVTPALVVVALAGLVSTACTRGHPPAKAVASPTAAGVVSPSHAVAAPLHQPSAGAGYVSDVLPMGYWLSLDHRLKQSQTVAAPKGVTPNFTYVLDEGTENLITDFGEQLARSVKGEPSFSDCQHAAYSTDDLVDVPRLPTGSWFCARDKAGRLAKVLLDGVDEDKAVLRLAYLVWR
jgi:hypothetical protein